MVFLSNHRLLAVVHQARKETYKMTDNEKIIKEWLDKCEREHILPWQYDFKLELKLKSNSSNQSSLRELQDETNSIKRLLKYLLLEDLNQTETEKTPLAIAIYSVLWELPSSNSHIIDFDVMNSFWVTYKTALFSAYSKTYTKWSKRKINTIDIQRLLTEYSENKYVNELFEGFSKYTHTIGNFVLESKGFNMGRKNDDYWDLGLIEFKAFLDIISPDNAMWVKYIDSMFLQPFVNKDYCISELWDGHFSSTTTKPKIDGLAMTPIKEFCHRTCCSIEERGKIMVKILCEKIGQTQYEFYESILKSLHSKPKFSNDLWT